VAIGDQNDITSRLQQLSPHGWFANGVVPLRDALFQGAASTVAFLYSLMAYVRLQTRIGTATDGFLDMIAGDFFGTGLTRAVGQTDASLRARIILAIFRERGTRAAIVKVLQQLTGRTPIVFEPLRLADTGAYGGPLIGYGVAGGYGSMLLPMQSFVTAFRPVGSGIPNVAGYGTSSGGYGVASQAEYASLSMVAGSITDADIYAAIESVRPATYVVWARVST
jgi:hypothetical protein